jgi:hypothetical protein
MSLRQSLLFDVLGPLETDLLHAAKQIDSPIEVASSDPQQHELISTMVAQHLHFPRYLSWQDVSARS